MTQSTPLLDEKKWLDGRTLALEGETEGLRAPATGLEGALEGKAGATTAAPEEKDIEAEGQRRVTRRRLRVVAATAPNDRECAALRRKQLASDRQKAR
jgi:hypothetical protein